MTYLECADGNYENLFLILNKPKRYVEKRYIQRNLNLDVLMQIYEQKDYVVEKLEDLKYDFSMLENMSLPVEAFDYFYRQIGYQDYLRDYAAYRICPMRSLKICMKLQMEFVISYLNILHDRN